VVVGEEVAVSVKLRDFERVVFFTGAGMSAESGVPTYRGKGGTWEQYDYEEYACQAAFNRDPEKVWDFHDMRREKTGACAPHPGHGLISAFEAERPSTVVVTQNIDGMHQRAGSQTVHELHGSLWRVRCDACGELLDDTSVPLASRTHSCGAYLRPDIVWFGDMLRMDVVRAAQQAIESCDALVSIGTSAVVYPAAELPLHAKRGGAKLIEVNPEPTPLSDVYDVHLRMPASEALAQLLPAP
jgi:NAD-dependent deacetylase